MRIDAIITFYKVIIKMLTRFDVYDSGSFYFEADSLYLPALYRNQGAKPIVPASKIWTIRFDPDRDRSSSKVCMHGTY